MVKTFDDSTKKTLMFVSGLILEVISLVNYNQYQIPAIIGILFGIFLIVKSLS
ncbi:hypothetical protein HYW74_04135 [Candidatus Pacearchaeota archaeon]|nr:hypothetical protein [Candidatus Pacearchaeota archaeon]